MMMDSYFYFSYYPVLYVLPGWAMHHQPWKYQKVYDRSLCALCKEHMAAPWFLKTKSIMLANNCDLILALSPFPNGRKSCSLWFTKVNLSDNKVQKRQISSWLSTFGSYLTKCWLLLFRCTCCLVFLPQGKQMKGIPPWTKGQSPLWCKDLCSEGGNQNDAG